MGAVAYGARGIVGLLVPQANTTAEPEMSLLLGPDLASLVGRLTSPAPDLRTRLGDYLTGLDGFIAGFGEAPLSALGFLMTGATYPLGHAEEDALFAALAARRGFPIVSAAQSIRRALAALGAKRVGLVSPYPPWLTEQSLAYWRRAGVEIVGVEAPKAAGGFHDIYTLPAAAVLAAGERLLPQVPDAIILSGTGMPTLAATMRLADAGATPLSSNLCMAWQLEGMATGGAPDAASLLRLLHPEARWRADLAARFPGALGGLPPPGPRG